MRQNSYNNLKLSRNISSSNGFGFKEMNNDTIVSTPTPLIASTMRLPIGMQENKFITSEKTISEVIQNTNSNQVESMEIFRGEPDLEESRKSSLGLLPFHCLADQQFEPVTPSFMKEAISLYNSTNPQLKPATPSFMKESISQFNSKNAIDDAAPDLLIMDQNHKYDQEFELAFGRLDPAKTSLPLQFQKPNDQDEIQRDFNLLKNKIFTPTKSDKRIPSFYWKQTSNKKEKSEDVLKRKLYLTDVAKTGSVCEGSNEFDHTEKLKTDFDDFGKSLQLVEIDDEEFSNPAEVKTMLFNDEKDFLKEHLITEDMNLRPSYINSCETWRISDMMEGLSKKSCLENSSEKSFRLSDFILQRSSEVGVLDGRGSNRPTLGLKIKTPPTTRKPMLPILSMEVIEKVRMKLLEKSQTQEYNFENQSPLEDSDSSSSDRTLLPFDLVKEESGSTEYNVDIPNEMNTTMDKNSLKNVSDVEDKNIYNTNNILDDFEKENYGVLNTISDIHCILPNQKNSVNDSKDILQEDDSFNNFLNITQKDNSMILNISHFIEKVNSEDNVRLPDTIIKLSNSKWIGDIDLASLKNDTIINDKRDIDVDKRIAIKNVTDKSNEKEFNNCTSINNTEKINSFNTNIISNNSNIMINPTSELDLIQNICQANNFVEKVNNSASFDDIQEKKIKQNIASNVRQLKEGDNAEPYFNQKNFSSEKSSSTNLPNQFIEQDKNVITNKKFKASKDNEINFKNYSVNMEYGISNNLLNTKVNIPNELYDDNNSTSVRRKDKSKQLINDSNDVDELVQKKSLATGKTQNLNKEAFGIDDNDRVNINVFEETLLPISNAGFRSPRLSFFIPKTKQHKVNISSINDITLDDEFNHLNYMSNNIDLQNVNFDMENIFPLQICKSVTIESNRTTESMLQTNLLPIQFERVLKFMGWCCVGTIVKLSFMIYNPNKYSINVSANIVDKTLPKRNFFMLDKTNINISANSGSKLEISYAPLNEGMDEAYLYLYSNEINDDMFSVVTAQAEFPKIKMTSEDGSNYLDFQYIPLARRKSLKILVENIGMSPVPLHLFVKNSQDFNQAFVFVKKLDENQIQPFISCHCLIEPFNNITLSVIFQAPEINSQNSHKVLEFSGKVEAELDNVNEKVAISSRIGSLVLVAKTGVARLHIPNSLETIKFKCTPGKKQIEIIPLVNKGLIPLNISFELNLNDDSFIISPCEAYLPVNEIMNLSITFCPNNLLKSNDKNELLLLITIEPDGPIYEIPLVAEIVNEALNSLITQKNLFASSDYICFFKYDEKTLDEKLILMNNSTYEMRLFLEILNDTPGHLFKFVTDTKSNLKVKEKLISSRIIMIEPKSNFHLRVRFLANLKDLSPAFGRLSIKGEGSNINSVVLLYGYCHSSNVIIDNIKNEVHGEIFLNSNNCAQLSIHNIGNRTSFVLASVVPFEEITEHDYNIEPLQFCLKPKSQRYMNINISNSLSHSVLNPKLLTLNIYMGDEILRHLYKNVFLRAKKSQQNMPNLPANIIFDASIDNEEGVQMHHIYANIPDRLATQFSKALNCIVVTVKMGSYLQNNLKTFSRMYNIQRPTTSPERERPTIFVPQISQTNSRLSISNSLIKLNFPFANIENSILLFTKTAPSATSNKFFNISNYSSKQITWCLFACSPIFFKEADKADNCQIKDVVFRVKKNGRKGHCNPNSTTEVFVYFCPLHIGLFTQYWDIILFDGVEECKYTVQLIGEGGRDRLAPRTSEPVLERKILIPK